MIYHVEPKYYRSIYPELEAVAQSSFAPASSFTQAETAVMMAWATTHYNTTGVDEGRSPHLFFDPRFYLPRNADLLAACGPNGFRKAQEHWIINGLREGRAGSVFFDPSYYVNRYGDLTGEIRSDGRVALRHYIVHGIREGRVASPLMAQAAIQPNGFLANAAVEQLQANPAAPSYLNNLLRMLHADTPGSFGRSRDEMMDFYGSQAAHVSRPNVERGWKEIVPPDGRGDLPGGDPDRPIA
jgi:hypothetical protein